MYTELCQAMREYGMGRIGVAMVVEALLGQYIC